MPCALVAPSVPVPISRRPAPFCWDRPAVVSLLPAGWLESVLNDRDERAALRSGRRYMSNITIAESTSELAALSLDALATPLAHHTKADVFTGAYAGPGRSAMEQDFERNLAAIYARADTARPRGADQGTDDASPERQALTQRRYAVHAHPEARRDQRLRSFAAGRMDRSCSGEGGWANGSLNRVDRDA